MFPAGAAGTGLFILRVCASGTLLTAGLVSLDMSVPTLQTLAIWALIILIFLGLFTPATCAVALVVEVALRPTGEPALAHTGLHMLATASLLMLGPGAYSVDSKLFGRRRILPPPR